MGLKVTDFLGLVPAALGRAGALDLDDKYKEEEVVSAPKTDKDERMAGTKGLGVSTTTTRTTGGLKKGGKVAKAKAKKRKGFNGKGAGVALRGF